MQTPPTLGQFALQFVPYVVLIVCWVVVLRAFRRLVAAHERIADRLSELVERLNRQ